MEVNIRGTLLATQLVLPEMVARRRGRILNMSSHAGVFRWPLVVRLLGVEGRGREVHREPCARDAAATASRCSVSIPGLLPIGMGEVAFVEPSRRSMPTGRHVYGVGASRDRGRAGRGPGRCGRLDHRARSLVTTTSCRDGSCRCTTTSTRARRHRRGPRTRACTSSVCSSCHRPSTGSGGSRPERQPAMSLVRRSVASMHSSTIE